MRSAFLALAAAAFVSGANLRVFDALLPSIAEDFAVAVTTASRVVTAFTFAYGLFQIVHGPLGDRVGKLRIIWVATLAVSIASLGCAFAPSLGALTWLRLLTGLAAAAIVPLSLAWIGDNTSYQERQATIGRYVGFLLFGQVMGPFIGGVLSQAMSWREVFYVLAAVYLVVAVMLFREDRRLPRRPAPAAGQRRSVLSGYARVLRDRWVLTMMSMAFLEGALFFGVLAYTGAYLRARFALSYVVVGAVLACYGTGGILYSLLVRRLLARLGEKGFVTVSGAVLVVCFASLPLLPVWQAAIPLFVVLGFGFYLLHNTLQTRATEMFPAARGMAIALFAFSLFLGQATGVALYARLVEAAGYLWAFVAAGVLLLLLCRWFAWRLAKLSSKARAGSQP